MKKKSMKYKKIFVMIFTTVIVFMSVSACGKDNDEEDSIYETLVASGQVTVEGEEDEELLENEEIFSSLEDSEEMKGADVETRAPEVTPMPEPAKSLEVAKTSKPTQVPMATQTSTPTQIPAATPTPTQAPVVTSTPPPEPTQAPEAILTPMPEPTQAPEETFTPTPAPTPTQEHIHEYVESVWYEATCFTTGYHNFVCKECGAIGEGSGDIPMLPHDLEIEVVSEGNCASPRVTRSHCKNCTYVGPKSDDYEYHANNHVWETGTYQEWSDEAFAMVDKERTYCKVCNKTKE